MNSKMKTYLIRLGHQLTAVVNIRKPDNDHSINDAEWYANDANTAVEAECYLMEWPFVLGMRIRISPADAEKGPIATIDLLGNNDDVLDTSIYEYDETLHLWNT